MCSNLSSTIPLMIILFNELIFYCFAQNQGPEKTDNDEAVGDDANAVVQFKNGLEEKEKLVAQLKVYIIAPVLSSL